MGRPKKALLVAEEIRRCRYCDSEMAASGLAYLENPYCVRCFRERTAGTTPADDFSWRLRGRYVERVEV